MANTNTNIKRNLNKTIQLYIKEEDGPSIIKVKINSEILMDKSFQQTLFLPKYKKSEYVLVDFIYTPEFLQISDEQNKIINIRIKTPGGRFIYAIYSKNDKNQIDSLLFDNGTLFPERQLTFPYQSIASYQELLYSNYLFLHGKIGHTYYHYGPIDGLETLPFSKQLLKLHKYGIFTDNSQQCCDDGLAFLYGYMHRSLSKSLVTFFKIKKKVACSIFGLNGDILHTDADMSKKDIKWFVSRAPYFFSKQVFFNENFEKEMKSNYCWFEIKAKSNKIRFLSSNLLAFIKQEVTFPLISKGEEIKKWLQEQKTRFKNITLFINTSTKNKELYVLPSSYTSNQLLTLLDSNPSSLLENVIRQGFNRL